jgi:hypothetical protein
MGHVVHVDDFHCFYSFGSAAFAALFYFRVDVIFAASFLGESINSAESTFKSIFFVMFIHVMRVHLYRLDFIIFFSQILFVWLITSVSYCHLNFVVITFVDFVYQLGYSFLSRTLSHIGFFRRFNDNFVCCLLLLDQGYSFDAIIYHHHHIILFHYLPFAVVHHIISSA